MVELCPSREVARPWKIETELVTPCCGHDDSVAVVVDRNPCHFYDMKIFSILNVGIVESGTPSGISDAAGCALTWTTNVERCEILDVNTRYSARAPANIVDSEVEGTARVHNAWRIKGEGLSAPLLVGQSHGSDDPIVSVELGKVPQHQVEAHED